jgi:carboxypeptidase family protein/TonB-dependent receptor-like protein
MSFAHRQQAARLVHCHQGGQAMLRKKSVVLLVFGVLAFTLFGYVHTANAQVLFGSASGTITDQSGAAVPKAHVASVNKATGVSKGTDADAGGFYTLTDLPPGIYDITVTAGGFRPLTLTSVNIGANVVTHTNFNLQVGSVSEKVTVEADAVTLQTEKSDVHTEISSQAIEELPLNQYRNYQTLINLVPGATPGQFQNAIADTPERALTTNINGTNRNNNNTRVDGAADVFVWLPHHSVYVPPAETIQEVNVSTNNFDPEQGMTGGAAVTVITKSGSNQFHGVLFEYHQDQALRARQYFETPEVQPKKGTSILNDMGGTFGGPIKKDKLFFFGSWNGTFERDNRNTGLVTVPTEALRNGDFTGLSIPTTIYEPSPEVQDSNGVWGAGRTKFPNQAAIPIDPIAAQIIADIPLPNVPGATDINNYFFSATQSLNRNNFDAKVDWNRTTNHTIFVKYSAMKSTFHGVPSLGKAIGDCACDGGLGDFHSFVQLVTLGHTLTLSPTLVIDGNVGFTRMSEYGKTPDYGTNIGSDVLGIPGTNNGSDLRSSGYPYFAVSGFANIGNPEGWNPAFRNDWSFTTSHNVRWSKGKHQISAGIDIVHHHLNHWQPELGSGPRGEFDFDGNATALNGGAPANQFNAWAQFLLGLSGGSVVSGLGKSDQFIKATAKEWQYGFFFGDRYRVSNKLTLNLGLRYEYYPLMTRDSEARFDRLDFSTLNVLLGGIGGNSEHLGVTTSKKLFAPRIGLAYQVSDKMVVRSGFGITIDPLPLARPLRGFYPFTVGSNFQGVDSFTPAGSLSPLAAPLPSGPIPVGIPPICCPDISSGTIPLPAQALERSVPPGELKRGYIESWNLIVERRLPGNFLGSVGYVGTQTVHAFGDLDLNSSLPGTGQAGQPYNTDTLGGVLLPTISQFRTASTLYWQGFLSANYHSLQASLNRQFKNGFTVKGAYTWSKAINMTDDDGWAGLSWNDPSVLRKNRAAAGYDTPQIFQMSYIYELPFGSGKKWANSGTSSKILGGWQTSGIFSSVAGQPFQLTANGGSLNAVGQTQTPDQVGPAHKLGGVGTGHPFYDPSAFVPVTDVRYGNVGRNSLRGPGSVNFDFSLFRMFKITERVELQFRADAANLFNAPHFLNPSGDQTSANFLTITNAKNDERQFRFGLRLAF